MSREQHLMLSMETIRRSDGESAITDLVEVVELDDQQRAQLPPDTMAVPVLPLVLIEPKDAEDDGPDLVEHATGRVAWGVDAVGATDTTFTGSGVKVAVIDSGIDETHPAFDGINLIQQDFVSPQPTAGKAPDQSGHGTHCAGTIFGRDVDDIRIGVAPGIDEALIAKVFAPGVSASTLHLAAAINWSVSQGADVISMSLGMDFPGYVQRLVDEFGFDIRVATSKALKGYSDNVVFFGRLADSLRAAQAFGQPVTIVAASGNESGRHAPSPFVLHAAPPASAEGFHAVGAVARSGDRHRVAPFSNAGPTVVAPGVGVVSAEVGGGLKSLSGTSMATPHLAGLLALHIERLRSADGGSLASGERAMGELLAAATTTTLVDDWNTSDYGAGLAQAPKAAGQEPGLQGSTVQGSAAQDSSAQDSTIQGGRQAARSASS